MAHDPPPLDATRYPRSYRLSTWSRNWMLVLGAVAVGLGGFVASIVDVQAESTLPGRLLPAGLFGAMILCGAYLCLLALRYSVCIDIDRVEVIGTLSRRLLLRRDIIGVREVMVRNSPGGWLLVAAPGAGRNLRVSGSLGIDADFRAWLGSFPDLEQQEGHADDERLDSALRELDERYGPATVRWLRRAHWPLVGGSFVLLFGLLYSSAYARALTWAAVAWPWLTVLLAWRLRPLFRFGTSRHSGFADLSFALYGPGIALTISVMRWAHSPGWPPLIGLAVVGGLLFAAGVAATDARARGNPALLLLMVPFGSLYGYGAGMALNARLDRSAASVYPVHVISKFVSHGRSTSYTLRLSPWGPVAAQEDIPVSVEDYANTEIGAALCARLRSGALGIPWYGVWQCTGD